MAVRPFSVLATCSEKGTSDWLLDSSLLSEEEPERDNDADDLLPLLLLRELEPLLLLPDALLSERDVDDALLSDREDALPLPLLLFRLAARLLLSSELSAL